MLLPALSYSIWIDALNDEDGDIALTLRSVQDQTGLMEDYLQQKRIAEDVVNFDSVHRALIVQHAYLPNGISDFVMSFGPAIAEALGKVDSFCAAIPNCRYDGGEVTAFVEHMQVRARTEMQHRQRMLDRISMYLQVLYNLMQQQIARETKRDSSAMKSLSLLTMVFLPAPAIATVMSPFISISADDRHMSVSSQFWVFWAVAAPITVFVLLAWLLWLQRVEVLKYVEEMVAEYRKIRSGRAGDKV